MESQTEEASGEQDIAADETYRYLLFEVANGIATITLNRPQKMNAFTFALGAELSRAYARCDADDAIRVVILTGAGNTFCAGGGSDTFSNTGSGGADKRREPTRKGLSAYQVRKPVIAAINGHAVGIGLTLALQCDIRIVAQEAKLAFPFVRLGIVPELGSTSILPAIAGMSNALDLMLSGRKFSGEEAVRYGLASTAVAADEVVDEARAWAQDVASNTAPVAVALTKRLVWEGPNPHPRLRSRRRPRSCPGSANNPMRLRVFRLFLNARNLSGSLQSVRTCPNGLAKTLIMNICDTTKARE